MSTDAHTPVPRGAFLLRPSAEERERVVRILRDRSVEGRLSMDTFAERVGLAYQARSGAELAELTSDVRPASAPRRALLAAVEWLSGLQADLEAAWSRPRVASLGLPRAEGVRLVVGRSPDCDCVVPEECASRRHAEIWREAGRWFLRDLGSRNGTRLNGMSVAGRVEIRAGDRVSLGGATYRLSSRT
jgi:FHA domain-containing protein/uncharacterized protein DUF1707